MSVIKGTAYWAHVVAPNTKFVTDGEWSVDVGNLDATNKKIAQSDGLSIKNKGDEKGDFITVKRRVKWKDGALKTAPKIMDAQKNVVLDTLIGNGSEVNVLYTPYEWSNMGKSGVSGELEAIQILNLIPYIENQQSAEDAFGVVPDGFISSGADEEIKLAN